MKKLHFSNTITSITSVLELIPKCMFHSHDFTNPFCCSTVFTNLTSKPSSQPCNTVCKMDICHRWLLLLLMYVVLQDTEVLWNPAWDHSTSKICTGKLVRHSHYLKFPTVLLLVEYNTSAALAILMECDSVIVGVRTEGMKLLKMVSIKIIVLWCDTF